MPVTATDIAWYGSAVMPRDDVTLNIGGAIDLTKRIVTTRIGTANVLEIVSDDGGDTSQTVTVYYLDTTGALQSEVKTLNGLTAVPYENSKWVFLRALKSASTTGNILLRKESGGATIVALAAAELEAQIPFYDPLIDPTVAKTYYERFFVKNNHATLAVLNSTVRLSADPQSMFTFALDTVLNGTGTNGAGNSRQVAPAGFSFDATDKNVANSGSLTAGAAQGIWGKMSLSAGKTPFDDTYTMRLVGVSA